MELTGRRTECQVLAQLVTGIRSGESRALVIRGEPGVGKSALLDHLAEVATGCRLARTTGVQSEMELAFAGLHQLCSPMLDLADRLPGPQRNALRTAFGMGAGPVPDRFLIGLAVLGLLSEYAADRPLVCLVDDEHWLDHSSVQVLAFVARRLSAESVALVFAARTPSAELAGLPELVVANLQRSDARAVLDAALTVPLDAALRDRIVAESRGNPLALVEVPRALATPELAGGFGLPGSVRHAGRIEDSFTVRFDALPALTRRLLVLASAETTGDPALVWKAAAALGIGTEAATPAIEAGLADFGVYVHFRHPLARSVIYRAAAPAERQQAHLALAAAIDSQLDPDRRAWHRALATAAPDDEVADELEASAGRARARGGLAAAAAFLERATMLTVAPGRRATRALAAAAAKADAGALSAATTLLGIASAGPLDELQLARVDLIGAQLAFVASRGSDAPPLLLKAAKRLEGIDIDLARATYLDAFSASWFAGRLAVGGDAWEVARLAGAAPQRPGTPQAPDLFLTGLAAHYNDGYAACLPILHAGLALFDQGMSPDEELRWLWMASNAAIHLFADDRWNELSQRHVQLARDSGALSELPLALTSRAFALMLGGDLRGAASLIDEVRTVTESTGSNLASNAALGLATLRGQADEVAALTESTLRDANQRGEGYGITAVEWANAVLCNGTGRFGEAMAAAQRCGAYLGDFAGLSVWGCAELVEAAVRSGMADTAVGAHRRIQEMAAVNDADWLIGIETRARALLAADEEAEPLYRESIDRLGRTQIRTELARAHLLYGEWLGSRQRRTEARTHLHTALDMLETIGMAAFADRARRGLRAAGETARGNQPAPVVDSDLTAQEAQIAGLARDGLSNPEIGARLFISARTVQYHLRKVFVKLGINSRSQLDRALPGAPGVIPRP